MCLCVCSGSDTASADCVLRVFFPFTVYGVRVAGRSQLHTVACGWGERIFWCWAARRASRSRGAEPQHQPQPDTDTQRSLERLGRNHTRAPPRVSCGKDPDACDKNLRHITATMRLSSCFILPRHAHRLLPYGTALPLPDTLGDC